MNLFRTLAVGAAAASALTFATMPAPRASAQAPASKKMANPMVTMQTTKGTIKLKLYPEVAPNTVNNFIYLINKGFYNGLTFHRVEPGFVIQGGDPQGNGRGGPGWEINNEDNKQLKHNVGALAMANAGSDTAGSQFYVVITNPAPLDMKDERGISKYTIFGQVTSGQNVAEKIAVGDKMTKVTVDLKGYVAAKPVAHTPRESGSATPLNVDSVKLPVGK